MSSFKDRLALGTVWILIALLFALVAAAFIDPEQWIGWEPFAWLTLIGLVATPSLIVGVYVLGTIAEYALRVVSAIRQRGSV